MLEKLLKKYKPEGIAVMIIGICFILSSVFLGYSLISFKKQIRVVFGYTTDGLVAHARFITASCLFSFFLFLVGAIVIYLEARLLKPPEPSQKEREAPPYPPFSPPTAKIYDKLESLYIQAYGTGTGEANLKKKIQTYLTQGLNHEEAIRKVAQDEGYQ